MHVMIEQFLRNADRVERVEAECQGEVKWEKVVVAAHLVRVSSRSFEHPLRILSG
jgi:hypothetical protein